GGTCGRLPSVGRSRLIPEQAGTESPPYETRLSIPRRINMMGQSTGFPRPFGAGLLFLAAFWIRAGAAQQPARPDWTDNARRVHARFTGQKGTFAQFGDSITVTQAFWGPLAQERKNAPTEMERAFARVKATMRPEC